ncbi:interleukin-1 receptor type 1-like isoform X1 [Falco biarmicus]|uniref:interleukin-1 receptor type 1-like isoform X1 n=1 Tax=Falco peregrinus TaxID=8954 RepID=UPI000FFBE760|nr:interleukin-1 receptor type 1-like isoform X1 [Falco peregrinus]XP_027669179.1 interleukin-1 receptor type 1 isoform X1 [Falco cherrug]XP_037231908.1 interleukin-1 receptor type 1-like isoform X2 [Falco rusticolus]XP_055557492.1 interleukin-1 receptor type 1 isoform X1 [Falco cherrug]XP_055557494.1 interleukin-1 receptor type 1 isoform X1 [Falco cherrug]XP_055557495.1 interleukin-1 receptor type 1 isoform X1 [Falco cherrug]XP_055557496.1 interleukin-1 receptor type 1 isoform X1 [Falco cher
MTSTFLLIGHLILLIPVFSAEKCIICDHFVLVGEPIAISCPVVTLPGLHSDYNLTWYKNGSPTPVTTETHARIHQREGLLWIIPAMLEDSGRYECDVRSFNHSNKKTIHLTVFENDNGLCFNGKMKFEQKVTSTNAGKIICPDLEHFTDEDSQPEVHWYKECKPGFLEDKRLFLAEGENAVLIYNAAVQDRGNYTCRMVYTYMGKQYNVSRTMSLEVKEGPLQVIPEFIYPRNNTIEVELGSHVVMECNVSSGINGFIPFWQVNDEDVDSFDSSYREQFYDFSTDFPFYPFFDDREGMPHGLVVSGTKFNISKVEIKDYAYKFFCHFIYGSQHFSAYIKLERPARNIQGYLIGAGVSLVFLVFFTLFIYKIFRIDIVLWYRDSCHPFLGKKVSDGKIYDAYVLYPKNGESCLYSSYIFALKILPEVLERQCGYKLFIFGRDDLPGEAVISVADEKIRQSRRVIIVLVPEPSCYSILEDASEKQLAMYNALIQDSIKVILIELEKIHDYAAMPESIKYIKQKHGAIRWNGDFSERSHSASTRFWKKVRYHMPSRKNGSSSGLHLLPKDFNSP